MIRMSYGAIVGAIGLCVLTSTVPAGATVRVVATIFPLTDMVQQIGREHVEVVTLLPPGANPHTFEPTPAQIRAVADADVCVRVGGVDAWTAKLVAARGAAMTMVTLTDGLKLLTAADPQADHGLDPHVWLDPVLMRDHAVRAIVDALGQVAPDLRPGFEAGASEFRATLTRLDSDIRAILAPVSNRNYVAFHSAWRYFGLRYDLHEVAAVEGFPGKEPSAHEIAGLVQQARAARVHAMLIEPQFDPRVAAQIAREFSGHLVRVDPIGGPSVPGGEHYVDLMRFNAHAIAAGLVETG